MITPTLWHQQNGAQDQMRLVRRLFLSNETTDQPHPDALLIAPVREAGAFAAAVLVPGALAHVVSHNGVPMPAGMFLLRHADRIDFETSTFWVAITAQPEHAGYQPDVHGQDVFCFITKARLKPDELITICPGRPESRCGMIYKRAAWEMALEASTFKCPNCQFDPRQPGWEPPSKKSPTTLDAVFRILSEVPAR